MYNLIDHFGTDISTDLKIFIPQTWQIFLAFSEVQHFIVAQLCKNPGHKNIKPGEILVTK